MKRIGFTCSAFDLFHAGHVMMLEEAKKQCDYLIVGLQTDPTIDRKSKNKPVQSLYERFVQVRACKYVDDIIVYQTEAELLDILRSQPIDVRILGSEYRGRDFTGKDECRKRGVKIYYNKREHSFSTTELRRRIYHVEKSLEIPVQQQDQDNRCAIGSGGVDASEQRSDARNPITQWIRVVHRLCWRLRRALRLS